MDNELKTVKLTPEEVRLTQCALHDELRCYEGAVKELTTIRHTNGAKYFMSECDRIKNILKKLSN